MKAALPVSLLVSAAFAISTFGATVTVLKNGTAVDGINYYGKITVGSNGLAYGAAGAGGANGIGCLFVMTTTGGSFNDIYDFTTATGSTPLPAPIEGSDGKLYGTCTFGGTDNVGVVYSIHKDGSGYTVLHNFTPAPTDGWYPYAGLVEASDGKLYGTTYQGGASSIGTIYRVRKDGTGFTLLRSFTAATDGAAPIAGLIQGPDGRLYGTTTAGGANTAGTVFAIRTDGAGFIVLRALTAATDGAYPYGSLLYDSSTGFLYGAASAGGTTNAGTVFRISTSGTKFLKLHEFSTATVSEGKAPFGSLSIGPDGRLYGAAGSGGTSNFGTLFSLAKTGGAFKLLHRFTGITGTATGTQPYFTALVPIKGTSRFIGTTLTGGTSNGGTIFSLNVPLAAPKLTITTKPPAMTSKAKIVVRGKASAAASLAKVEYNIGSGAYKTATGTRHWRFTASLKKGKKNIIHVRAVDSIGQKSAIRKVAVRRN